ncbi:hypothetical protein [Microlunatus speluncae]|uniref:hypothetical protein n=1 Tax=Microlunatus speluncae TaxID=2594267 RepID=UPI0012664CF3|nr:hypothetical protein [Microlunatus speluncae]
MAILVGLIAVTPAQAGTNLTAEQSAAQKTARYWLDHGGLNMVIAQPVREEVDLPAAYHSSPSSETDRDRLERLLGVLKAPRLPDSVGRVFFLDDQGKRRWCTGVALQARYRNVVATAGQCADQDLDHWIFVPGSGSALGRAPLGAFVGQQAFRHYDFEVYDDHDRNYAFVAVHDGVTLKGKKLREAGALGDVVPGQGFAWNQSDGVRVIMGHAAGWPTGFWQRSPDDPVDETFPVRVAALKGEELLGIRPSSPFTNSLGSSWLHQYNATKKVGYLNGITIATSSDPADGAVSISAPFDSETLTVYRAADAVDTGSIL